MKIKPHIIPKTPTLTKRDRYKTLTVRVPDWMYDQFQYAVNLKGYGISPAIRGLMQQYIIDVMAQLQKEDLEEDSEDGDTNQT